MGGYLINFIVYTTAMVGIIFLAVFVYKKFSCTVSSKSKFLNVEECISLAPRKELYVVRAGSERFLVASDVGRTSLISKLDDVQSVSSQKIMTQESSILKNADKCSVDDLPSIVNFSKTHVSGQPKKVFKNIINNI